MSVEQNIRDIIKSKGYLQKHIAEQAGFTQVQFNAILTGRKQLRVEHLVPIARALNVTPNDLLGLTTDDKSA